MTNLMKLILPLGLGLAAGGLNWFIMTQSVSPRSYVAVSGPLAEGELFDETNLKAVPLSGPIGTLKETAIPYEDRAVLYHRPTSRDLQEGDLVLWRDAAAAPRELTAEEGELALPVSLDGMSIVPELLQVGSQIEFLVSRGRPGAGGPAVGGPDVEVIGPFRVLSVGPRLSRRELKTPEEIATGSDASRIVTVAIRRGEGGRELDALSRRLVALMGARGDQDDTAVMVAMHPPRILKPRPDPAEGEPGEGDAGADPTTGGE